MGWSDLETGVDEKSVIEVGHRTHFTWTTKDEDYKTRSSRADPDLGDVKMFRIHT